MHSIPVIIPNTEAEWRACEALAARGVLGTYLDQPAASVGLSGLVADPLFARGELLVRTYTAGAELRTSPTCAW